IVECIVVLALILVNGFFAMAEMAIVSSRKARLKQAADEGKKAAAVALKLAEDPNLFLSTAQTGIAFAGIFAGAFGGSTIAERLVPSVEPWLHSYAYPVSFGTVVAVITFLSVAFGELVPKRLALLHPESIAMATVGMLNFATKMFTPFVKLLSFCTDLVMRLAPSRDPEEPSVTDAEITQLMEQGAESGHFHEAEAEIVTMALRLGDRRVSSLMTPRAVMDYLDVEESEDDTRRKIIESPHSRFPLAQGGLEHMLGIVQVKDLLATLLAREKIDLKASVQAVPFVPQNAQALKALELFKSSGAAMAIVVDEYGAITGLLTLNDILEALVGDIADADAEEDPGAVKRDDGSWLVDGILPIDQLRHLLEMNEHLLDGEHNTVAGFMLTHLNRIAKVADHVEVEGYRFEVVDMDGRRIDKVLVVPPPPDASEQQGNTVESGGNG
ncbi:MAG: hemolysin family protein, partial [Myxococcota bacterium]